MKPEANLLCPITRIAKDMGFVIKPGTDVELFIYIDNKEAMLMSGGMGLLCAFCYGDVLTISITGYGTKSIRIEKPVDGSSTPFTFIPVEAQEFDENTHVQADWVSEAKFKTLVESINKTAGAQKRFKGNPMFKPN